MWKSIKVQDMNANVAYHFTNNITYSVSEQPVCLANKRKAKYLNDKP